MNAGVMGLNVNSSKLATISDNIANSETKGYKRSNMEFNSLVLTERPTSYDAGGVRASTIREVDDQGALLSTRNALDLAISGRGFFAVTDVADVNRNSTDLPLKLIRTGSFRPDENGVLQTNSGLALLAWPQQTDGTFSTIASDLQAVQVDALSLAAERTEEVDIKMNLNADAELGDVFNAPIEFFDTLGRSQFLDMRFTKTNIANMWSMTVDERNQADGTGNHKQFLIEFDTGIPIAPATTAGPAGGIRNIWQNTAYDGSNGATHTGITLPVTYPTDPPTQAAVTWAQPTSGQWEINGGALVDPGIMTITTLTAGAVKVFMGWEGSDEGVVQFSSNSQVLSIEKDGSPASTLVGIEIDETGVMDAIFDSGFRKTLYKIPVANVQNPNGMRALDGQAFQLTRESGSVYFYDAGAGPTGLIVSSALEESTTDVAEELTQLIKTQRAYSSNAKIIQTVDEMLQETTNLKR
jgi:flagellar hook protein FlgE